MQIFNRNLPVDLLKEKRKKQNSLIKTNTYNEFFFLLSGKVKFKYHLLCYQEREKQHPPG